MLLFSMLATALCGGEEFPSPALCRAPGVGLGTGSILSALIKQFAAFSVNKALRMEWRGWWGCVGMNIGTCGATLYMSGGHRLC